MTLVKDKPVLRENFGRNNSLSRMYSSGERESYKNILQMRIKDCKKVKLNRAPAFLLRLAPTFEIKKFFNFDLKK